MNIILLFFEIIFCSFALIFLFKKYKYEGVYLFILLFSLILGIISQKIVEIFELEVNLGFVTSSLMIIASNIIIQNKGPKELSKILKLIILSNIIAYSFSLLISFVNNSNINIISNESFEKLFFLSNRAYLASIISLICAISVNSILYYQIRQIKNKIWISNSLSSIIINFIECILFIVGTYLFKMPIINLIELIVIRYVFKTIICLFGTSIIYIVNSIER